MTSLANSVVPVAIGAVAVVLLLGLFNMLRGGSPSKAQTLMRFRVLLQFAALVLIMGMMNTRVPADVLAPFAGLAQQVLTLTIPGEANAHKAAFIAGEAVKSGFAARPMRSIEAALRAAAEVPAARVLICGSLYLAGHVLARNGTPPD